MSVPKLFTPPLVSAVLKPWVGGGVGGARLTESTSPGLRMVNHRLLPGPLVIPPPCPLSVASLVMTPDVVTRCKMAGA